MANLTLGSLYDFNKQAMKKINPLTAEEFSENTNLVISDIYRQAIRGKPYWMLLCNERKDYTVFNIKTKEGTLSNFKEALLNRGQILSLDKQKDGNYEIWIRDPETKENFAYYMFDYSFGIIEA